MARLNDGPITADSLDAARRRFLRQNRELARINSSHCVRIHNLETEKSRLLSENLTLHEENIQLRVELAEKKEESSQTEINVADFQRQFDEQVQALQKLATTLNITQRVTSKIRLERSSLPSTIRDWRDDVPRRSSQGEEWRLPTIVEDKYYPRRTLDADEIQSVLFDQTTDSPELGPPPVVNFHLEDPVKFGTESAELTTALPDEDAVSTDLSVNLESRKRRRDSDRLEIHRSCDSEKFQLKDAQSDNSETRKVKLPLRNGAKRKYHDKDYKAPETVTNASKEDFCYSKKGERLLEQLADRQVKSWNETNPVGREDQLPLISRRVLGDKSVNTDPVTSPKKARTQKPPPGDDYQKPRILPRNRFTSRKQQLHNESVTALREQSPDKAQISNDVIPTKFPPKTPDPSTINSPTSLPTAPSSRSKSRDTPPPTDLHPIAYDGTDTNTEQARPSRRARAAVNYAEPNLNRKMRRPTGAMVDAIGREERRQSCAELVVSIKTEASDGDANLITACSPTVDSVTEGFSNDHRTTISPEVKKSTVAIKAEETSQSDWKNLPLASPTQPEPKADDPIAEGTKNGKKIKQPEDPLPSAASSVISTLTATGRPASRKRDGFIKNTAESKAAAEFKDYPSYRARRSSSSSDSTASNTNSKSTIDMRSSPSIEEVDNAQIANNAAGSSSRSTDEASRLRAKRMNSIRTRRVSVGPGSIAPVATGKKDRTKDVATTRTSAKGLVIHRHGGGDEVEDKSSVTEGERMKDSGDVSDVTTKGRTAARRRSMLL